MIGGGHRANDVDFFAARNQNVIMYMGTNLYNELWKKSDTHQRLIIGSARKWQAHLIYHLYSQKNRSENYLFFAPDLSKRVYNQISCVQPNPHKKNGDRPENWEPLSRGIHDWFDVCKMAYLAIDFAVKTMSKKRWRFLKSKALLRRWKIDIEKSEEKQTKIGELIKK